MDLRSELASLFTEVLQSEDPAAAETRGGLYEILRQTGAFEIAVRQAVGDGDRELLAALKAELQALAQEGEQTRGILVEMKGQMLDLYQSQSESLQVQVEVRDTVQESLGMLVQLFQFMQLTSSAGASDSGAASDRWDGSPYLGLHPYRVADAPIFFGRSTVLADLLAKAQESSAGGTMLVTGPSGVGKSSLVRAGMVPAVANGMLREDPRQGPWRTVLVDRPGEDPVKSLAVELAKNSGRDSGSTYRSLIAAPEEAADRVEECRSGPDGARPERVMLVVDQFEELFTLVGTVERATFLTCLSSIESSPRAFVVLCVRSDFVDRCMAIQSLGRAVQGRMYRVGPMTRAQLHQAVVHPAGAAGIRVDGQVVEAILDELCGTTDGPSVPDAALPLLSQTMLLLWERESARRRLTYAGYLSLGGVANAVRTAAERAYGALDPREQDAAISLFRRLVGIDRSGRLVRLSLGRDSVAEDYRLVIDAFLSERLLVADEDRIEIAHDVLLDQWSRLHAWLEAEVESRILHTQLEASAAEWDVNGREPSFLYEGVRLVSIVDRGLPLWRDRPELGLEPSDLGREFITFSRRRQRRRDRIRYAVYGAFACFTALVSVLGLIAAAQNIDLEQQRNRALAESLIAQSESLRGTNGQLAQLLAAAAWQLTGTDEAYVAMTLAADDPSAGLLTGERVGSVESLAFSPEGALMLSATNNGTLTLWETADWESEPLASDGDAAEATAVEFSSDGSQFAGSTHAGVTVWDTARHEPVSTIPTTSLEDFAFSPDGRSIAIASLDGVSLWNIGTGEAVRQIDPASDATAVEFSGAGLLVGRGDGMVQHYSTDSGEMEYQAQAGDAPVTMLWADPDVPGSGIACAGRICQTFDESGAGSTLIADADQAYSNQGSALSPDGSMVATFGQDEVTVHSATTAEVLLDLPANYPMGVAFMPDSGIIAAGTKEGIQLWDSDAAPVPALELPLESDNGISTGLTFTTDGTQLFGLDTPRSSAWEVPESLSTGVGAATQYSTDWSWFAEISPDGSLIATDAGQYQANRISLLDTGNGYTTALEPVHSYVIFGAEFSPDGRALATTATSYGFEGAIRSEVWIWDLDALEVSVRLPEFESAAGAVRFTPDGSGVVISDSNGRIRLWDAHTGELVTTFRGNGSAATDIQFSHDGRSMAAATVSGLSVWDFETGEHHLVPIADLGLSFSFSPDDQYIVSNDDELARVWHLDSGQLAVTIHWERPAGAEFSPTRWQIAVTGSETVRLFDVSFLEDPYAAICDQAGRSLTKSEWEQYLPDIPFREFEVCP
ncbi:WD40 repeat [Glycomyces harbinensis]|uniref:WD40 repeat n=2 Tax=Glycomyces harbinensis TaxID=58114 RepID=A0A1G7DM86_9ACTN|nr:WD40 repeat [Glycomyces harbinensis]